jgi:hypothetical protein
MKPKHIVISAGSVLRRVSEPKPEDIIIISESELIGNLPSNSQNERDLDTISRAIIQTIHKFSKLGLPGEVTRKLSIGPNNETMKSFLCSQIEKAIPGATPNILKSKGIYYVYDLIFWDEEKLKKINGLGAKRILIINQAFILHGFTQPIINHLRKLIPPEHHHSQVVQILDSVYF